MRIKIAKPTKETPMRRSFKTSSKITFFDLSFSAINYEVILTSRKLKTKLLSRLREKQHCQMDLLLASLVTFLDL